MRIFASSQARTVLRDRQKRSNEMEIRMHCCALKGSIISSQVYSRTFSMGRHARRPRKKSSDKPNSRRIKVLADALLTDQQLLVIEYVHQRAHVRTYTCNEMCVSICCSLNPPRRVPVRLNSSAKLSLFPPEAPFTEHQISHLYIRCLFLPTISFFCAAAALDLITLDTARMHVRFCPRAPLSPRFLARKDIFRNRLNTRPRLDFV